MIGILIVSHEPLGTALLNCTRHIFGRLPVQLAALDVIPDEDPAIACRAAGELMSRINDGSGVVVLTDVFGATPSRIAMGLADPLRVVVIAGVNLPMLLKALGNRRAPLEDLATQLIASAKGGILEVHGEAPPEAASAGQAMPPETSAATVPPADSRP